MNESVRWSPAPATPALKEGTVDVWRVKLEQPPEVIRRLGGILSGDEEAKAARFHFHRDRRRYIIARGSLRLVLGQYARQSAGALHIDYTKYGRPFLPDSEYRFNVSHAHELALIACTLHHAIGVDLEYMPRDLDDLPGIAARFFSPAENAAFLSVPPSQRRLAFFNCWTRKEAYIKALGEGLSHPLDSFDVTLRPDEEARFLRFIGETAESAGWSLRAFTPGPDYVAALAIEGPLLECRFRRFSFPEMPTIMDDA